MKFNLETTICLLERTPETVGSFLEYAPHEWTHQNEGENTWSAFDVVGHLVHCEECNWIQRILVALSNSEIRRFQPLDRFAQIEKNKGKTLHSLLEQFRKLRKENIQKLKTFNLTEEQLTKTALHPDLGSVTLSQIIATWLIHDLDHLSQISRVMAKQYKSEVGPWMQYLRILNS